MEELGTMSKNNLRGITLVRGPIWDIHSLTLIISCLNLTQAYNSNLGLVVNYELLLSSASILI